MNFKKLFLVSSVLLLLGTALWIRPITVAEKNTSKETLSVNIIKLVINNKELDLKLENNATAKDLIEKLDKGNIELQVDDYGGFEKVGDLPLTLAREDKNQTSKKGDVMLYQGNKLVIFTGSNTWSYSKIGDIDLSNIENLEETLGAGEQKVILKKASLYRLA